MKMNRLVICVSLLLLALGVLHGQAQMISLKSIKKIFVDKMPDDLDQYIRAEITKQFKGTLLVVLEPAEADAILAGAGERHRRCCYWTLAWLARYRVWKHFPIGQRGQSSLVVIRGWRPQPLVGCNEAGRAAQGRRPPST
jgi:hypothetical protein